MTTTEPGPPPPTDVAGPAADPVTSAPPLDLVDTVESVICPSCGATATVHPRRRASTDFCPSCDFPLFWAGGRVVPTSGESDQSSWRRLPGTAGVATVATRPCPACQEQNLLGAVTCLRCGALMDPPPPPPPPPPPAPVVVVVEPPPPVVVPAESSWWMLAGLILLSVVLLLLVAWASGPPPDLPGGSPAPETPVVVVTLFAGTP